MAKACKVVNASVLSRCILLAGGLLTHDLGVLAFSAERQEDDLANSSAWKLSYCLLLGQMLYHARRLNPERIKYKQFLRLFDTAQGITTDRSKPTSFLFWNSVHKRLRHEYIALDRSAQSADARHFVDSGTDHREVKPFATTSIAVEHVSKVEANIDLRRRQMVACTALVELANLLVQERI